MQDLTLNIYDRKPKGWLCQSFGMKLPTIGIISNDRYEYAFTVINTII